MVPCHHCGEKLYPLERMTLNTKVYHKTGCAKCTTCKTNLNPSNFAFMGDQLFCKTHYMAAFSRSGGRYSFKNESYKGEVERQFAPKTTTAAKENRLAAFLSSINGADSKSIHQNNEEFISSNSTFQTLGNVKQKAMQFGLEKKSDDNHKNNLNTIISRSKPSGYSVGPVQAVRQRFMKSSLVESVAVVDKGKTHLAISENRSGQDCNNKSNVIDKKSEVQEIAKVVSLKDRIACYQARAAGLKSPMTQTSSNVPYLPSSPKKTLGNHLSPSSPRVKKFKATETQAKFHKTPTFTLGELIKNSCDQALSELSKFHDLKTVDPDLQLLVKELNTSLKDFIVRTENIVRESNV